MKLAAKGPLMQNMQKKDTYRKKDPYRQIYNHVYKHNLTQNLSRSHSHFNTSIETDYMFNLTPEHSHKQRLCGNLHITTLLFMKQACASFNERRNKNKHIRTSKGTIVLNKTGRSQKKVPKLTINQGFCGVKGKSATACRNQSVFVSLSCFCCILTFLPIMSHCKQREAIPAVPFTSCRLVPTSRLHFLIQLALTANCQSESVRTAEGRAL